LGIDSGGKYRDLFVNDPDKVHNTAVTLARLGSPSEDFGGAENGGSETKHAQLEKPRAALASTKEKFKNSRLALGKGGPLGGLRGIPRLQARIPVKDPA
jgi:hypothetical protein